jgi:glutathione S-transferase
LLKRVLIKFTDRMLGQTKDQALYEQALASLSSKLDGYERILAKQKYLAGDVS